MANDNWQGRSHGEIVGLLGELKSDAAHDESKRWDNTSTAVADSIDIAMGARQKLLDNTIWDGDAARTAYDTVDSFYKESADPQTGLAAEAGKISQAALQDGETLIAASRVAQNYPEPGPGAPTNRKKEELEAIRAEAQRMYTDPLSAANRPEITDGASQQQLGQIPQGSGAGSGGGGNSGSGSGGGTQTPPSTDGLANKDTKPQLAGGDGQQAGAGQGQGQGGGQGSGSGGGQGSGSGAGSSSGGSGSGLGSGSGGSGLPIGSTTAAGFSPSSTGTGVGGSGSGAGGPGGLSALRGGAGLPGGAAGGTGSGINPAAVGAAGVRGGGPMGMMGSPGAHGRGGKGEDDGEKATPQILINYDNTDEFLGDMPAASPGVIGDWSEQEKAEKAKRDREIRRYKALGWDVKFE